MKYLLSAALFLLIAGCVSTGAAAGSSGLIGQWEKEVFREGNDVPFSVLTVELWSKDQRLVGTYCHVTAFGNRIDCDPDSGANIHGLIDSTGRATVRFQSSFGGSEGTAELRIEGDALLWTTTQAPSGARFYGPDRALLNRVD